MTYQRISKTPAPETKERIARLKEVNKMKKKPAYYDGKNWYVWKRDEWVLTLT